MHVKGQLRKNGKDHLSNSLWFFESPLSENRGLNDHLAWLLDHLEPKIQALNAVSQSHRVDLFCGFRFENIVMEPRSRMKAGASATNAFNNVGFMIEQKFDGPVDRH